MQILLDLSIASMTICIGGLGYMAIFTKSDNPIWDGYFQGNPKQVGTRFGTIYRRVGKLYYPIENGKVIAGSVGLTEYAARTASQSDFYHTYFAAG